MKAEIAGSLIKTGFNRTAFAIEMDKKGSRYFPSLLTFL